MAGVFYLMLKVFDFWHARIRVTIREAVDAYTI